jgi:aryl carrier-like protein
LLYFQLFQVGCWQTNGSAFICIRPIVLLLTLLRNIGLEICDVTNKSFLPPFPATYALLELLAVPFEEFIVGEKLVDRGLAECQLIRFAGEFVLTGADCSFSNSALTFASSVFCSPRSDSIRSFFLAVTAQYRQGMYWN